MNKQALREADSDYNPDGYRRNSFAQIMQGIFAEQMIRLDRTGREGFDKTHREQMLLRAKIMKAYTGQPKSADAVPVAQFAEGVLFALRDGVSLRDVMRLSNAKLLKMAREAAELE